MLTNKETHNWPGYTEYETVELSGLNRTSVLHPFTQGPGIVAELVEGRADAERLQKP